MKNLLSYLENSFNKYPGKIALSMRDETITYGELRRNARLLASTVSETIRKDKADGCLPIGVFAERGTAPAVRFMAVLYSGNYYVPLDPDMPENKLKAVLDDASITCLIGSEEQRELADKCRPDAAFITSADANAVECPFPSAGGSDPAYMVYTSGSTGKPKGVIKSHSAVISFIEAFCSEFPFSPDEVIGNQTPFFFDASAKDIYLALSTASQLDIIPTELFAMPVALFGHMNEKKITFASWVPTAISIVATLDPFGTAKPEYLRRLFFVGEVMPMKHLNKWRAALPDLQYVNLYGQSELAGICTFFEVRGSFEDSDVLPMGRPLSNCSLYLVNGDRVINEPRQKGELYIVSPALADCYFNDPEKTSSSFLVRDFGKGPERCFKTGDLAEYDEERNLIFASRTDFQIKHMGHRIELGEIDAVAGALPGVVRCCCLYNNEQKKIVLFCETSKESKLTERDIIRLLRSRLSGYMLPRRVVFLEHLPLGPNGKIDRQGLKTLL